MKLHTESMHDVVGFGFPVAGQQASTSHTGPKTLQKWGAGARIMIKTIITVLIVILVMINGGPTASLSVMIVIA